MGSLPVRQGCRNQGRQRRVRCRGLTPPKFLIPLLIPLLISLTTAPAAQARVVAESSDLNGWMALGAIAGVLALGLLAQSTRRFR